MAAVNLMEFVEALQSRSELEESVIDVSTGKICFISEEALQYAENNDTDYPAWQAEDVKLAQAYFLNPHQFMPLPSTREVDEYRMMVDFAANVGDQTQREHLLPELSGAGVFRRFKSLVRAFKLEKEWYDFREKRYQQFAREWCEGNGFAIQDN